MHLEPTWSNQSAVSPTWHTNTSIRFWLNHACALCAVFLYWFLYQQSTSYEKEVTWVEMPSTTGSNCIKMMQLWISNWRMMWSRGHLWMTRMLDKLFFFKIFSILRYHLTCSAYMDSFLLGGSMKSRHEYCTVAEHVDYQDRWISFHSHILPLLFSIVFDCILHWIEIQLTMMTVRGWMMEWRCAFISGQGGGIWLDS